MKDTQKKILETACSLLEKYGYPNFSYGLISENMQISKGLVAYHFPQKSAIFRCIVEDYFIQIADYLERKIDTSKSATVILDTYISGIFQYVQGHKTQTLAVMEIISNDRTDNGELIYDSSQGIDGPILKILEYGQGSNEFFCFDTYIMTKLIRSLIDTCSYEIAHDQYENEDYFIAKTIEYIKHMVKEN